LGRLTEIRELGGTSWRVSHKFYNNSLIRPGSFFGIYHITLSDPDSVYTAFEAFVGRLLDEQSQWHRTNTENFLMDEQGNATIKFKQQRSVQGNSMYSAGGGVPTNTRGKKGKPIQEENTFSKDLGQMEMPPEDGTFKLSRTKSASNVKLRKRKCCKS
jgi:hypothetical protein